MKIKARKYYEREYGKVNARRWNKRYPRRDNPDGTYFQQTPRTMAVFISQIEEFKSRLRREP